MMAQFGVEAERDGHERFRVVPGAYAGRDYAVEPDASTASYFFAAAAVTGGRVKVLGLRARRPCRATCASSTCSRRWAAP